MCDQLAFVYRRRVCIWRAPAFVQGLPPEGTVFIEFHWVSCWFHANLIDFLWFPLHFQWISLIVIITHWFSCDFLAFYMFFAYFRQFPTCPIYKGCLPTRTRPAPHTWGREGGVRGGVSHVTRPGKKKRSLIVHIVCIWSYAGHPGLGCAPQHTTTCYNNLNIYANKHMKCECFIMLYTLYIYIYIWLFLFCLP